MPIDPRISAITARIAAAIPEAQVLLFGHALGGTARPDSDVDLLITLPDHWLIGHERVRVLECFGANSPAIGCRLTCFFTPKVK